jgi:Carboxypeptidase regulatory-like domain
MSRRTSILSNFTLLLLLLIAGTVAAQNFRGGINGTVTDPTGAAIPSAKISAVAAGTSAHYNTVSSSAGEFLFQDLPIGQYTISVDLTGFQTAQINQVPVVAGSIYTLQVKLSPAQVMTKVEVSANQLALDTTQAILSTVIPNEAVQDVPNNGRDYTVLVAQAPGFAGYAITGGGGTGTINGSRSNQINYQIEGTDNNDIWWNVSAVNQSGSSSIAGTLLPLDAISEFSFVTNAETETSRNSGGTANVVIKSGTNQLHGSAYYFNRNEFFAAASPFAPPDTKKNEERNANEGGSVGGPVWKDKLFFFVAFEYQRFVIGNSANATEPSTAYQAAAASVLSYYGIPVNTVATGLLANAWPAYALTGPASAGNYYSNAPASGTSYNGIIKLDSNLSNTNHLSFKWFAGDGKQVAPDGSDLAWYYQQAPIHVENYSLILDTTLSAHLANQVSLGVNYFKENFADAVDNVNPIALGLNTGVTDPSLAGSPKLVLGPPSYGTSVSAGSSGFDNIAPISPSGRQDIAGHLNDSLSYVVGAHQLQLGGEYRRDYVDDFYQTNGRGVFNFDGSQGPWNYPSSGSLTTCDALATQNLGSYAPGYSPTDTYDGNVLILADFMAGCISSANIVSGNQKRLIYMNTFNLFAQDSWQAFKRLNLSFGAHYDYYGPIHNGDNNLTVFNPTAPNGLAVAGTNVANVYQSYWKGVTPRFGFAYQPKNDSQLVFRGGFGLFYDSPYLIPFMSLRGLANGGAVGAQDNPAGSNPVAAPTIAGAVIVPNQAIFPSLADAIAGAGVISVFSISPKYRPSYTSNFHFDMQMSLGRGILGQIGYVGSVSRHLTDVVDINQAALGSGFANPTCDPQYANAGSGNQQCSRPYFSQFPNYSVINQVQSGENANYNSLQAILKTQSWHGLTSQFSYTWSHGLDYETGLIPYLPQDSTNLKAEYGNSDFDTRHAFASFIVYNVPGSAHGPQALTHGWQLNSGLYFHSGQPFTVLAGTNASGNGENADRADTTGIDPFAGVSHALTNGLVQWFNPAAFTDAPAGQYGTTRRGQYTNPGFSDVDFSVIKNTKLTERVTLQLRAEMFNLFNRINLAPVGDPGAGDSGGSINSTIGAYLATPGFGQGEPFNTQLAAKIVF